MRWPSFGLILTKILFVYIAYSIYTLSLLFEAPAYEEGKPYLQSFLAEKPKLQLILFTSVKYPPGQGDFKHVYRAENFDYTQATEIPLTLNIPPKTQNNGSMFMYVVLVPNSKKHVQSFNKLGEDPYMVHTVIELTQHAIPKAEVFNLLGESNPGASKDRKDVLQPVTHIKGRVTFRIMTDDIKLPVQNVPLELMNSLKIIHGRIYLPIVTYDLLQTRHNDLIQIMPNNKTVNITVLYSPIALGRLRLLFHIKEAMKSLTTLGFSNKDIDEVKMIVADTNIYVLAGTIIITAFHMLFDFLAFKNDISFWRQKDNLVGISKWTVVWHGFSHTVIFLYLLDEGLSLLIIIPTGIATLIEMWKIKRILKLRRSKSNNSVAEIKTRDFDAESMRYLSYLLYPVVIGGAIYSLLYQPQKSWYSWTVRSVANGVYAFGFLFMLPQLFVNYKLKSVAHLPWRTFMYKAFNTFIDDVFAFIITMPTAHRIACFRDDVVFLIYLYQRWLYPVDKSRTDIDSITEGPADFGSSKKKTN